MLVLPAEVHDLIVRHARAEHPVEACGFIVRTRDGAVSAVPMRNAACSATYFRFDPAEQLRVWQRLDDEDATVIGVYHSHTASAAYPSAEDVAFTTDPQWHCVIVSTRDAEYAELRSFRVIDAHVIEERLHAASRA